MDYRRKAYKNRTIAFIIGFLFNVSALGCIGNKHEFDRQRAEELLDASLQSREGWETGTFSGCRLFLRTGAFAYDLIDSIEVTGVSGGGETRTATFSVHIAGDRGEQLGEGAANFVLFDDGWRLQQAYVANCQSV